MLIVQKFGGTSLAGPEAVRRSAQIIAETVRAGAQVALVGGEDQPFGGACPRKGAGRAEIQLSWPRVTGGCPASGHRCLDRSFGRIYHEDPHSHRFAFYLVGPVDSRRYNLSRLIGRDTSVV